MTQNKKLPATRKYPIGYKTKEMRQIKREEEQKLKLATFVQRFYRGVRGRQEYKLKNKEIITQTVRVPHRLVGVRMPRRIDRGRPKWWRLANGPRLERIPDWFLDEHHLALL